MAGPTGKSFLSFPPLVQLREATLDEVEVAGQVLYNQVRGPALSEPACGKLGRMGCYEQLLWAAAS